MEPEQRARLGIDSMLSDAGWLLQDREELNLSAGPGVEVRELSFTTGEPDYTLFVDGRAIGVVEAKPEGYPSYLLDSCARHPFAMLHMKHTNLEAWHWSFRDASHETHKSGSLALVRRSTLPLSGGSSGIAQSRPRLTVITAVTMKKTTNSIETSAMESVKILARRFRPRSIRMPASPPGRSPL